ncbi:MAG: hypothetical protein HY901_26575 [Deltaproteobacteria bacterium]|nr:hypothetical protein [Deltaproteobacteria bacterium]
MTRTIPALAATAAALLLLAGCNAFVPPKVACDEISLGGEWKLKAERPGVGCAYPEVLVYQVVHAPRVDTTWAEDNGSPGDISLVSVPVKVTAGSGSILLCDGVGCDPTLPSIDSKIDTRGGLSYQLALNLERSFGVLPGPGGSASFSGVAAAEVYGPGNSCYVSIDVTIACEEATE